MAASMGYQAPPAHIGGRAGFAAGSAIGRACRGFAGEGAVSFLPTSNG